MDPQIQEIPKIDLNANVRKLPTKKIFLGVAAFLLFLFLALGIPGFLSFQKGQILVASSKKFAEVAKSGNILAIKEEIPKVRKDLASFRSVFKLFSWTKIVPFWGGYIRDVDHGLKAFDAGLDAAEVVVTTMQPYAQMLGFVPDEKSLPQEGDGAKTTQERIDFVVKAIPDIIPKLDLISQKLAVVKSEVDQINAQRYPQEFRGRKVRENIKKIQDLVDQGVTFVTEGKPLLEIAPSLLGISSPKNYLVLFQNDKELRPTGGFMTAYSLTKVSQAKFEPTSSNDIYNLDAKYRPVITAPDPIVNYIKGPYVLSRNWRLRDMNWSPDFAESMALVGGEMEKVGIEGIDGIIAVDTQLLVNLLDVLGQIGVPGFGNFSTKIEPICNCPQVIYELESFADTEGPIVWDPVTGKIVYTPPNYDNRKKIIGPLMNSILANALGQPKDKLPDLFEAIYKSLTEKHMLFYLFDEEAQKAVSDFGIGGRIEDYPGDYLHINDSNLGGRKSNLYVTQEVSQEITLAKDGSAEKTLTVTYKNPEKHDGWLNSVLPNWVRIYVPKGSELIAAEGFEDKSEPYEEFGKTVFAGFFKLRPEGVSKVTLKYKLPDQFSGDYQLLIQKQPGTDRPLYTIHLGKYGEEFFLKTDREIKIRI